MENRNFLTLSVIWMLFSLMLISVSVPSCHADLANWGIVQEGSSFHNGTHISMPYADVHINITRNTTNVSISMDSEFHMYTNTTQNATLAFVYPSSMFIGILSNSDNPDGDSVASMESDFLQIMVNGSVTAYTIQYYSDFIDSGFTENFTSNYPFVQHNPDFAVFETELIANTTLVLSASSSILYGLDADRLEYYYIVGSARTFESDTQERVQIHLIEEVPFLETRFEPDESLTLTTSGNITDAVWNFNISEFSSEAVGIICDIRRDSADIWDYIYPIGFVVFIVFLVYQFGYKKSKQSNQG
ncbi:MAG: hypothetical protein RTV72_14425 [Candidatus Thorarchaeota archaeon]